MSSRLCPCSRPSRAALQRWTMLVLATLVTTLPALATTYVMVSDEYLVESSAAAVEARVLSADGAPGASLPSTDYMIEVEQVLAGDVSGRNLIVRVPGGVRADGVGLVFDGMPELVQGERVVLFLNPSQDGTWAVSHLMLGAFHEVVHRGEKLLVRDLTGTQELAMPGEDPGSRARYHRARRAESFTRWVESVGRGDRPRAEYFYEDPAVSGSGGAESFRGQFRFFRSAVGLGIRWFEFDGGGNVQWRMQGGGQPGFSQGASEQAFRSAMGSWNNDNGSRVDYRYQGTTGSTQGFNDRDNTNSLIFANADGSITGGDFRCTIGGGGTLALGGPWFIRQQTQVAPDGKTYHPALEAEIITNRGIECFLSQQANPQRALEQLLAHELGHTLGIDHPCTTDEADAGQCPFPQSDALMYPYLHEDSRGAVLNSDDRNAVRGLYPGASTQPTPRPTAPSGLEAEVLNPRRVRLTWDDNANNESSYAVQVDSPAGFVDVATLPANTEIYEAAGLDPEEAYTFRVRARNSGGAAESGTATVGAIPPVPTDLAAVPVSKTSAALTWDDSAGADAFEVEARNPVTGSWSLLKEVPSDGGPSVSTIVSGLASGTPYSFRLRAKNERGRTAPSEVSAATPPAVDLGECVEEDGAICLLDGRFRVSVTWRNQRNGDTGIGVGERFEGSDRTGTFWFFSADNTELIVKMLDGSALNDFYWTFYGALTDVEYWVSVLDTTDGASRTYYNPPANTCGELDTASIPATDVPIEGGVAVRPASPAAMPRAGAAAVPIAAAAEAGTCAADATTLCLLDNRFAVTVDWQTDQGTMGVGTAVPDDLSEKTGYFWFFNADNVELVVKALDGGPVNGNFWFFYGALSNVEYTITVTDTVTGRVKTYENEQGNSCGELDDAAFPPVQ